MDNPLCNRIEIIKKNSRMTIEEFTALIGVSKQSYSGWIAGAYPNSEVLIKILKKFPEYSAEWLLLGEGEMINSNHETMVLKDPSTKYGEPGVSKKDLKQLFKKMISEIDNM